MNQHFDAIFELEHIAADQVLYILKVAVSQDLLPFLYYESHPPGPLINRHQWFG